MKKLFTNFFSFALTMVIASALFSCSENGDMSNGENTYTDKTDLWPAYSPATGKWGYVNDKGEMVVAAQYDKAKNFSCGFARVKSGGKYYFIDSKGQYASGTAIFDDCDDFYNSYALIEKDDLEGLLNTKMEYAIQPLYKSLGEVGTNGMLSFKLSSGGKYGYMDTSGNVKIEPQYESAREFIDGVAVVKIGSKYGAINSDGVPVIQPVYDILESAHNGLLIFKKDDCYGMLDKSGNVVVQPIYKNIMSDKFGTGLYPAQNQNGKCGYIDASGNVKINFDYDDVNRFNGEVALVKNDKLSKLINKNNEVIKTFVDGENKSTYYEDYHNGLYLIRTYEFNKETQKSTYTYQWIKLPDTVVYTWVQ